MDPQEKQQLYDRIAQLEKYCFDANVQFQADVFESILISLEHEGLGIGKRLSADSAAFLEITSLSKGFRVSRMTQAQRDLIKNPGQALLIYNLDTDKLNLYTTTWEEITSA